MPLSSDVSTIVDELIRADLAWLAVEVIEAIELPQPVDVTSGDVADHPQLSGYQAGLEMRWDTFQSGRREIRPELQSRPDLTDAEQLALATEIVGLRLVEPVRRLAEAERIAGRIAGRIAAVGVVRDRGRGEGPRHRWEPVAFSLDGRDGGDPIVSEDLALAEEFAALLVQIAGPAPRLWPIGGES